MTYENMTATQPIIYMRGALNLNYPPHKYLTFFPGT